MKKFAALLAIVSFALLGWTGSVLAGAVPIYGGPAQANPIQNPADQADINALVGALNAAIGPGLSSGNTGLFTSGSIGGTFQSQGLLQGSTNNILTTGIQCIRSSASGGCGTFSFFLTFTDSQGVQSFIPVYK